MWRGPAYRCFLAGLLIGGLVMGLVLGSLGALIASVLPLTVGATLWLVLVLSISIPELLGRGLTLPQNARAVPQQIITADVVTGPVQFGFEMGTGVRTFMPSPVPHMVAAGLLLTATSPVLGAVAGLGFGLGRAAMTMARSAHSQPPHWDRRLRKNLRVLSVVCVSTAIGCALLLSQTLVLR